MARDRRATARWTAALALAVAIQWTGGHVETSMDALFALGLYCLARGFLASRPGALGEPWRSWIGRVIARPLWAVTLGTLLAAPALAPFLEWLPLSAELQARSARAFVWLKSQWPGPLMALPQLVAPDFWGNNPLWRESWNTPWVPGNYSETALYVGVVPLTLACGALVEWARERGRTLPRWALAWGVVGAIAFGMTFRLPVFDWINQAPILRLASPSCLRLVLDFALSLWAGVGMQLLLDEARRRGRVARWRWPALTAGLGATALALAWICPLHRAKLFVPALILAVATILLALGRRRGLLSPVTLAGLLLLATVADLFVFGVGYNPAMDSDKFYPHNPIIDPIRKDQANEHGACAAPFRVTALRWTLIPDAHLMEGLSDVRGMDFPTRWLKDYLAASGEELPWISYAEVLQGVNSPLVRVLNVKYVLASNDEDVRRHPGLIWMPPWLGVFLGEIPNAQPRSFMVHEAIKATDDRQAAEILRADPAKVFRRVVLCDAPAAPMPDPAPPLAPATLAATGARAKPSEAPGDEVVSARYQAEESAWRVRAARSGYLVTTDAYYPGWEALLDGRRAPIHRANLAFRAIWIPAGEHVLIERYRPMSLRLGLALATLALAAIGWPWLRSRARVA
jgi:hypothetical protein